MRIELAIPWSMPCLKIAVFGHEQVVADELDA